MTTARDAMMKVPAVTLGFWIIKILATTLGETGGDSVSMSWLGETTAEAGEGGINGYLIGTAIFGLLLVVLAWVQVRSRKFNPGLYWATIVASTTVGTTLADFCTRSLGIGYPGGSFLLFACVLASLAAWYKATGTISVNSIVGPREEIFYWVTITFSQTLGTALGDWTADSAGLGYLGSAAVFLGLLGLVVAAYAFTRISRTVLFWAAFVLTRPLGAVIGDFLDKPVVDGGLALSRYAASGVLLAFMAVSLISFTQRPIARGERDTR